MTQLIVQEIYFVIRTHHFGLVSMERVQNHWRGHVAHVLVPRQYTYIVFYKDSITSKWLEVVWILAFLRHDRKRKST